MTFSILARDAATGQLGVATATHAFGVGPVANFSRAGVGVVATQSFVEISYGPRGLDLLAMGIAPAAALTALLSADDEREIRQVAFLGVEGAIAHHTGARCVPSCGAIVENGSIAIGNMLDNDGVLPAMSEAFHTAAGELAERLLAALEAGCPSLRVVSPRTGGRAVAGHRVRPSRRTFTALSLWCGWREGILLSAGEVKRGCELVARGIAARPGFARFVDGLHAIRTISMTSEQIMRTAKP